MKIKFDPGEYVIAVSGGVDSMVLLDLAAKQKSVKLIVAHFDHGIHNKSAAYCKFVAIRAKNMELEFASEKGNLGSKTSEATARKARYEFLNKVKNKSGADAIITAHHQDDLIETILINIIRGTGRKGLASLRSDSKLIRPLLNRSKKRILDYATNHKIVWREDPTNTDEKYLRNYLRLKILPKMSLKTRQKLLKIADENKFRNEEIKEIINSMTTQEDSLNRKIFNKLDHGSSKEMLADFLRQNSISFDKKLLEQCVNFIKTGKSAKKFMISNDYYFEIQDDRVKLNLL